MSDHILPVHVDLQLTVAGLAAPTVGRQLHALRRAGRAHAVFARWDFDPSAASQILVDHVSQRELDVALVRAEAAIPAAVGNVDSLLEHASGCGHHGRQRNCDAQKLVRRVEVVSPDRLPLHALDANDAHGDELCLRSPALLQLRVERLAEEVDCLGRDAGPGRHVEVRHEVVRIRQHAVTSVVATE